ncbi:unnamed protein product [Vicia faba]|uniref:Arginase n=1 Tax=Vicia faba TaxID=3906 RepID=A0AAV1ASL1_VICFA|nr:unnamed protein product [Vicia faba]
MKHNCKINARFDDLFFSLIDGLGKAGRVDEAEKVFDEMAEKGCLPDSYCYNALIDGLWMLQNPEYRQRLEEMLNNMGGGTEWDSRMMDTLKNFDLNSPAVKQQFDQIGQKLGEGVKGVYISIDMDCLDPAFAPGVSHIEPGGLSFRDVLNILHNLQGDVVAGDVVELNPQRDTVDGMTAMVAAKLVREMAAKIAK